MVTYGAFLIWVVHAGDTDEGNASHAKRDTTGNGEHSNFNTSWVSLNWLISALVSDNMSSHNNIELD